jgi:hypothetical protein
LRGRHFEVNEAVVRLISVIQASDTLAEAAQKYRGANGRQYSVPRCIATILQAPQKYQFLFKIELLSQFSIERFSNVLKIVFHTRAIAVLLLCIIALETWFVDKSTKLISLGKKNMIDHSYTHT